MRRTVFAVLALIFLLPITIQAQDWTPEQLEVWGALETCWDQKELGPIMACIHDDYVAWPRDGGVPLNKADINASMKHFFATEENVWTYRKPLSIDVRGDMAVVIYVTDWVDRRLDSKEESSGTINWTEVFVKTPGGWKLLADHGTDVEGG